jgi:hypothetical protein
LTKTKQKKLKPQGPKFKKQTKKIEFVEDIKEEDDYKPYQKGIHYLCGLGPEEMAAQALAQASKIRGKNQVNKLVQRDKNLEVLDRFKTDKERQRDAERVTKISKFSKAL